jgi:hypothetical protein
LLAIGDDKYKLDEKIIRFVSIGNRRNSRWPRDMNLPGFSHFKCKSIEISGLKG